MRRAARGASAPRPRAVLFDLGNVVLDWQPRRLYDRHFGDPAQSERFCATICTLEWHTQHDRGVPMDETIAALSLRHPEHASAIALWKTGWLDMFTGYVPGVPTLIARLEEARTPMSALTNMPAEKADETFDAFPLIKVMRNITVSGVEGLVKPDPEIYRIALRRMGFEAGEVLFIDDRQDNTDAAARLGFFTHRFTGSTALEAALVSAGLLNVA
jgi:FMN phosphatase YigB (HAD superfamily)